MQDSDVEESTLQLVIDQLEELVITVIEEVRERPTIPLALLAGVVGAAVGSWLARRRRATTVPTPSVGAAKRARIAMRLLRNPLVRALLVAVLKRQLRSRLSA